MNRKPEGTPASISKERMRSEHEPSTLIQNSKQSLNKTKLAEYKDLSIIKKKSKSPMSLSKNINQNQM